MEDITASMMLAVREGNLNRLIELVEEYGLSYSEELIDGWALLSEALLRRNREIAKYLISKGARLDYECYDMEIENVIRIDDDSPLSLAVSSDDIEIVTMLMDRGCSLHDCFESDKQSPLYKAIENNNLEMVKLLVRNGVIVDSPGQNLNFFKAVICGYNDIAEFLLENGADVNNVTRQSPLYCATSYQNLELVRIILRFKPEIRCEYHRVAVDLAITANYTEITNALTEYGFSVFPGDKKNSLFRAIRDGNVEDLEKLLQDENNLEMIRIPHSGRCCPLFVASAYRQKDIVKLLLSKGAKISVDMHWTLSTEDYKVNSILMDLFRLSVTMNHYQDDPELIFKAIALKMPNAVELLVKHNVNVNVQKNDEGGCTPLQLAVFSNNDKIVDILLKNKADVQRRNNLGCAALHFCTGENFKCLKMLLDHGANLYARDNHGRTPLDKACVVGDNMFVKFLLQLCPEQIRSGTALYQAVTHRNYKVVSLLLEYGADVNIINENGTAVDAMLKLEEAWTWPFSMGDPTKMVMCDHLIKLKAAGCYISDRNLKIMESDDIRKYGGGRLKEKHFSSHEIEIKLMKVTKIKNSDLSLYDILTSDLSKFPELPPYTSVIESMYSAYCLNNFPIYSKMIRGRYETALVKRKTIDEGRNLLQDIFYNLPHLCTEKILSYLDGNDVRLLKIACGTQEDFLVLNDL